MNILHVSLWGELVGDLFYDANQKLTFFKYFEGFKQSGFEIAPLLMPLDNKTEIYSFSNLSQKTFKGLPPVFSDSLPDKYGNTILNAWLQRSGKLIEDLNPLERLSYIGKRGMGALEYLPPHTLENSNGQTLDISDIVAIAKEVLSNKEQTHGNLHSMESILHIGTSAGGARAKAIIAIDPKTNDVFSGDIIRKDSETTYHILKLDGVGDIENRTSEGYGKIEYAYSRMAKLCGIDMAKCQLIKEKERAHFMTERFDRVNGKKVHMTTLNSIAAMDYNQPLTYSYEQCFTVMKKIGLYHEDFKKQFRRMVFNILAKNLDDHTKNVSFLMDSLGQWKLSPAYDVTYAYNPNNRWLRQHQMSVNGKRNEINRSDLMGATDMLDPRSKRSIIDQVVEGVSQWKKIAEQINIPTDRVNEIEKNLKYQQINNEKKSLN